MHFCRMTGQKKTTVDSRRASASRGNIVTSDWKEIVVHPLKHMTAWKAYAASNASEREWLHRVGLEGFVNLPWGQEIRKDVVENFLNTAYAVPQQSIIGQALGRDYVITPTDITNILRLPTGTTTEANPNPDPEKWQYWSSDRIATNSFTDPIPTDTVFLWDQ